MVERDTRRQKRRSAIMDMSLSVETEEREKDELKDNVTASLGESLQSTCIDHCSAAQRNLEMQRQLCAKILSKIHTNLISPKSVLKTYGNPFYQQSNGVVAKRFLSNTILKGRTQFPVRIHPTRNFHSLDSGNRFGRQFFRRLSTDGVVIGLIVTNVAVFVLWGVAGREFMAKNFMISVDNFMNGRLHTLITCAFSHSERMHIFQNMIGLYIFGKSVGQTFGAQYLLKLYLSGAVVGSIFYLVYQAFVAQSIQGTRMPGIDPSRVPALGASGAVTAIMLLDIFRYPTNIIYVNLIIPVPAIIVGIFIIGEDIRRALKGDERVSGSAHLGGATVAALAWFRSRRGRFSRL